MKYAWILTVVSALLVGLIHAQRPGGSGSGGKACPDRQATDIPASEVHSGGTKTCGIGFVAFGLGGGLFGEDCPKVKYLYPAHQKCQDGKLEGHKCVSDGPVPVIRQECDCGGLVIPFLDVGVPAKCVCEETDGGGNIEDFKTEKC